MCQNFFKSVGQGWRLGKIIAYRSYNQLYFESVV